MQGVVLRSGWGGVRKEVNAVKKSVVKIQLPLPSQRLNAHAKGNSHWAKSKATKELRSLAQAVTILELKGVTGLPWQKASLMYAFFWPDNRQRDETNYMQMLKAAVDGAVDAGLIVGDHWQVLSNRGAVSEIDRDNPRVELLFSRVDDEL